MKTHKDLNVWKGSIDLVTDVYQITERFPDKEKYGLISQLRRAAVSIPANISEGAARNSRKDYIRFLRISFGSISELETLFIIGNRLGLVSDRSMAQFQLKIKTVSAQLSGLIKSLEKLP
jgi:four helix bundle protein